MSALIHRWSTLPRSARWLTVAAAAIVAYFAAIEPALDLHGKLRQRADAKAAILANFRKAESRLRSAEAEVTLGVGRYGVVEFPGDQQQVSVAFNKAVDEVLSKHGVREQTSTSRVQSMGAGAMSKAVGQDFRVERLVRDIQFQSEPEVVSAVLADLERSGIVSNVPRVQLRQGENKDKTSRLVRTSLSVESWVISKKSKV